MPSAVEFRNVTYTLPGGRALVRDLNLAVEAGETMMLLGRSGSGKTTTLKLINHLLAPTSGAVLVHGRATTAWDIIRLRRSLGYVIQEVGLFPHFDVERNVGLVPRLEGWEAEKVRRRAAEMLSLVGLDPEEFSARFPYQLSGGQRQRVGVARALAADPPILLMDEPFGALDPITRVEIQREFRDLQKRLGKTVVFVTHDIHEAFVLGSRIALLDEGRLVMEGSAEEFRRSQHPVVRTFLKTIESFS